MTSPCFDCRSIPVQKLASAFLYISHTAVYLMGNMQNLSGFSRRIGSFASEEDADTPTMATLTAQDSQWLKGRLSAEQSHFTRMEMKDQVQLEQRYRELPKDPSARLKIFENNKGKRNHASCRAQIRKSTSSPHAHDCLQDPALPDPCKLSTQSRTV